MKHKGVISNKNGVRLFLLTLPFICHSLDGAMHFLTIRQVLA